MQLKNTKNSQNSEFFGPIFSVKDYVIVVFKKKIVFELVDN